MSLGQKKICIILSHSTAGYVSRLEQSLLQKKARPVVCRHPEQVMVMVMASRVDAVALIIDDAEFPNPADLLSAIKRYYPRTICWRLKHDALTQRITVERYVPRSSGRIGVVQPLVTREEINMLLGDPA